MGLRDDTKAPKKKASGGLVHPAMADQTCANAGVETENQNENERKPEGAKPTAQLRLEILRLIRDNRHLRGLRHTNYLRYRLFCSARIKRLRRGTKVTNTQSKRSKGFVKRKVELAKLKPKQLVDPRILELPLLLCERAWSHAMELREANTTEQNPRVQLHIVRKLRRADKAARQLMGLSAELADPRTNLEAEAYVSVMSALLDLELSQWAAGLEKLTKANYIYAELGKRGDAETAEICQQRASEVEMSLRYCRYNLGDKSSSAELPSTASSSTMASLHDRFEALLAADRAGTEDLQELVLPGGRSVRVRSEQARQLLAAAQADQQAIATHDASDPAQFPALMAMYDAMFVKYNDAQQAIIAEMKPLQEKAASVSGKQAQHLSGLELLQHGLKLAKLNQTILRNRAMIDHMVQAKAQASTLVRIYDTMLQSLRELEALRRDDDLEATNLLASRVLLVRASRCYHLAEDYSRQGKLNEMAVLLQHAQGYCATARQHLASLASPDSSLLPELARLKADLALLSADLSRKLLCIRADLVLQQVPHLEKDPLSVVTDKDLASSPDLFSFSFAQDLHFPSLPPHLQTMPCKPQLFDLALTSIELPDLEARMKPQKKGWFGLW